QHHPHRAAAHHSRTHRADLPLADRRSWQRGFLLLRRNHFGRPALLRLPLACRLSTGAWPAQGTPLIQGLRLCDRRGGASRLRWRRTFNLRGLAEAIIQRIAGAAHGADRIGGLPTVERLAQTADMDIDGALVDVDVAAPDTIEQLRTGESPAGTLHEKFQ